MKIKRAISDQPLRKIFTRLWGSGLVNFSGRVITHRVMRSPFFIRATLSLFAIASFAPASVARAGSPVMGISQSEARDVLNELLLVAREEQASSGKISPEVRGGIKKLLFSYRDSARDSSAVAGESIEDAPYPDFLIKAQFGEIWNSEYERNYRLEKDKIVDHLTLETLYDAFLSGVLNDSLPDSMKPTGDRIGKCLARRALRAASNPSCKLDLDETHLDAPGTATLAWLKLGCPAHLSTSCGIRKALFQSGKKELIEARKDPAVRERVRQEFERLFPRQFRETFLGELAEIRKAVPELITGKFKANSDDSRKLWKSAPLVETDSSLKAAPDPRMTLAGFVAGLRADLGASAVLANSQDARERAIAAPLFYAAANRLLLLTGGDRAVWGGDRFIQDATSVYDPNRPKAPPILAWNSFGGWGAVEGKAALRPFDWSTYDATRQLQLFPAEWVMRPGWEGTLRVSSPAAPDSGNLTAEQRLGDLAGLLGALVEFLNLTRPGTALGGHFLAPGEDLSVIFDPGNPAIFPRESRAFAFGIAAGILKNVVVPGLGHLEQSGNPDAGFGGLLFHDRARFRGRNGIDASTAEVSRLIFSASYLREAISTDPDVPAEFQSVLGDLDTLVLAGAINMRAKTQVPADGGLANRLGDLDPATRQPRTLEANLAALRALTRAYNVNRQILLRVGIKGVWGFLERMWPRDWLVPRLVENGAAAPVQASVLWSLLALWRETQVALTQDVPVSQVPWPQWQARFTRLERQLRLQVNSPTGPRPIGPFRERGP